MAVNKVEVNGAAVIDLTGDTVSAENLIEGATAHNAAGERITGTARIPTKTSELTNDSGFVSAETGYAAIRIGTEAIDLNDLDLKQKGKNTAVMLYRCMSNGEAGNVANKPFTNRPFILIVECIRWISTADYVTLQTIKDGFAEYVRKCVGGEWGEWVSRSIAGAASLSEKKVQSESEIQQDVLTEPEETMNR